MKTGKVHSSNIVVLLMLALSLFVPAIAQTGPTITNLSPSVGPVSPVGGPISIKGSGFGATQGSSTVTVGGIPVTPSSWSATKLVVPVLSSLPVGFDDVVVSVNGVASNARSFLLIPVITSVSPPNGVVGTLVTVKGTSFGDQQGTSTITFNGITATPTQWSNTSVTAPLSNTSGIATIVVTVNGFATNGAQLPVVPSISAVQPGSALPGGLVTIAGAGFGTSRGTVSQVTINGASATIQSWSANSIVATVPAGASSGNLVVTASNGKSSNAVNFAVLLPNPVIITPATTVVGSVVSVTGASFGADQADSTVTLGSLTLPIMSWTDGEVRAVVPPGAATGEVLATVQGVVYGAPLNVILPPVNGSVTTVQYDAKGQLISVTDPLSHTTSFIYTGAGLLQKITDALGNITQFQYDAAGNRTSSTDALQNTTSFTYDAVNRLTRSTFADGSSNQFGYDSRGRRISATDADGKLSTFAYDDADHLTSVTNPNGGVTQYSFDGEDNLISITDALQRQTTFAYDDLRRLIRTTFPSALAESLAYDLNGNLVSKTDRNGTTITYSYDVLDRLITKTFPDGTAVSYAYDLINRPTQVTDRTGTYGFSYDALGRLTGTNTKYNSISGKTFTMSYAYDNAGNRVTYTDTQGGKTQYSRDALDRVVSIQDSSTNMFGFSYDALGRRTALTRPNGVTTRYAYDSVSNLLSVLHKSAAGTIDGTSYTYDLVGKRTSKSNQLDGTVSYFAYDNQHQLVGVTQGGSQVESYSYDLVGNRLTSQAGTASIYNESNELTAAGSASYTYDNNGNILTKTDSGAVTGYTWDFENRLTSVTLPSGLTVSFQYDPFGRRIQKGTNNFLFDGAELIAETDASGNLTAQYSVTESIDEPLAAYRGNLSVFYDADGLGSITSLTTVTGAISDTLVYDSFGSITASTGTSSQPFRFTGRDFDSETGLYFYRARYYEPRLGRFLNEDPIGFSGGFDFYAYVSNDPINLSDPSGHKGIDQRILDRARLLLSNKECAEFLKMLLVKLKLPPNLDDLLHAFDETQFLPTPKGDAFVKQYGKRFTAHVDTYGESHIVHVDNPSRADIASTLLHEVFHTLNYGLGDYALASAIGYKGPRDNMAAASGVFSREMDSHCKECKK